MKKILFYCDTVFGVGGVQRVLAEVAKRLSEEYEVTILTTDDIRQTRRYDYHRSSVRFVSLIYAPVSIWRRLRQKCCSFVCKYLLPKYTRRSRKIPAHTGGKSPGGSWRRASRARR